MYAEGQRIEYEYRDGEYCRLFKTTYNYDRLKLPSAPISAYIRGEDQYGVELDYLDQLVLTREIKNDRACINVAEINHLIDKARSDSKKASLRKQLESANSLYSQARESLRDAIALRERILNMYENISYYARVGFEKARSRLLKLQDFLIDSASSTLRQKLILNESQKERIKINVANELFKLEGASDSEILRKKNELKRSIELKYTPILSEFEKLKEQYKREILENLAADLAKEKQKFLLKAQEDFTSSEEMEAASLAFDDLILSRKADYLRHINSLMDTASLPFDLAAGRIEQVIDYDKLSFTSLLVAELNQSKAVLRVLDNAPADNVKFRVEEFVKEVNPLVAGLIALMHSTDFQLIQVLNMDSYSNEKDKNKAIAEIINALNNKNYLLLEEIIENKNELLKDKIEDAINEQKKIIDREYELQIARLKRIDPSRLDSDENEYLILLEDRKEEIQEIKYNLDQLAESNLEPEVKEIILRLANAYDGYLDYLQQYFERIPSANIRFKAALTYEDKALHGISKLKERSLKYASLREKTSRLLSFDLLYNINEYVTASKTKTDKKYYTLSDFFNINRAPKNSIKSFAEDDERFYQNFEEEKRDLLKLNLDSSSNDEWEILVVSSLESFGINYNSSASQESVELTPVLNRESKRRAQRKLQGLTDLSWSAYFETNDDESNIVATYSKVKTDMRNYYLNPYKNMVITELRKGKNKGIEKMYFLNDKNQVISEVSKQSGGIVSFYTYDTEGRITGQLQALSKYVWDSENKIFKKPDYWNKKNKKGEYIIVDKIKWEYLEDTNVIKSRKEYSPLTTPDPKKASRSMIYHSIYDELLSKKIIRNKLYERSLDRIRSKWTLNLSDHKNALATKISRIEILGKNDKFVREVKVYHSEYLKAQMMQDDDSKNLIYFKGVNEEEIEFLYPQAYKKGVLDLKKVMEPYEFIDADGKIIGYKRVGYHSYVGCIACVQLDYSSDDVIVPNKNGLVVQLELWSQNGRDASCLDNYAKNDPDTDFILNRNLDKSDIKSADIDKFLLERNDYLNKKNVDLCYEVGLPIFTKKTYTFGKQKHAFWQMSHGAKFWGENKYEYWESLRNVVKLISVRTNRSISDGVRFSNHMGTFLSYIDSSEGEDAFIYKPSSTNDSVPTIIRVPLEGHGIFDIYSTSFEKNQYNNNNYYTVSSRLGYPISEERVIECDGHKTFYSKQSFIGGDVYNPDIYAVSSIYVYDPIRSLYDNNGGICGKLGPPTGYPRYLSDDGKKHIVQSFATKHVRLDDAFSKPVIDSFASCFYSSNRNIKFDTLEYQRIFYTGFLESSTKTVRNLIISMPFFASHEFWESAYSFMSHPLDFFNNILVVLQKVDTEKIKSISGQAKESIVSSVNSYSDELYKASNECPARFAYVSGQGLYYLTEIIHVGLEFKELIEKSPKIFAALGEFSDRLLNSNKVKFTTKKIPQSTSNVPGTASDAGFTTKKIGQDLVEDSNKVISKTPAKLTRESKNLLDNLKSICTSSDSNYLVAINNKEALGVKCDINEFIDVIKNKNEQEKEIIKGLQLKLQKNILDFTDEESRVFNDVSLKIITNKSENYRHLKIKILTQFSPDVSKKFGPYLSDLFYINLKKSKGLSKKARKAFIDDSISYVSNSELDGILKILKEDVGMIGEAAYHEILKLDPKERLRFLEWLVVSGETTEITLDKFKYMKRFVGRSHNRLFNFFKNPGQSPKLGEKLLRKDLLSKVIYDSGNYANDMLLSSLNQINIIPDYLYKKIINLNKIQKKNILSIMALSGGELTEDAIKIIKRIDGENTVRNLAKNGVSGKMIDLRDISSWDKILSVKSTRNEVANKMSNTEKVALIIEGYEKARVVDGVVHDFNYRSAYQKFLASNPVEFMRSGLNEMREAAPYGVMKRSSMGGYRQFSNPFAANAYRYSDIYKSQLANKIPRNSTWEFMKEFKNKIVLKSVKNNGFYKFFKRKAGLSEQGETEFFDYIENSISNLLHLKRNGSGAVDQGIGSADLYLATTEYRQLGGNKLVMNIPKPSKSFDGKYLTNDVVVIFKETEGGYKLETIFEMSHRSLMKIVSGNNNRLIPPNYDLFNPDRPSRQVRNMIKLNTPNGHVTKPQFQDIFNKQSGYYDETEMEIIAIVICSESDKISCKVS